ncbi:MAG: DUF4434 domain-containing protein [Oscillospiraceae bacterium]|nr:DUF4434 domain-containing protein [Oscillospiraceae bacterium]
MKKRILAIALTLAMLLSLLPAQVFATGPVINGGIHTEHNYEPVTTPELSEPERTPEAQTSEVQTPSQPQEGQSVQPQVDSAISEEPPKKGATVACPGGSILTGTETSLTGNWIVPDGGVTHKVTFNMMSSDAVLCLHGSTLTVSHPPFMIYGGHNLTIVDCKGTGSKIVSTSGYALELADGGSITLSGSPTINGGQGSADIFMADATIKIGGKLIAPENESYVIELYPKLSSGTSIKITEGWSDYHSAIDPIPFASADGYDVYYFKGEIWMGTHTHYMSADPGDTPNSNGETEIQFNTKLSSLGTSLGTGDYVLTQDISTATSVTVSGTVNLCLNGHTIRFINTQVSQIFKVAKNGSLNICDCRGSGAMIAEPNGSNPISVENMNSTVRIYGGLLQSRNNSYAYNDMGEKTKTVIAGGKLVSHGYVAINVAPDSTLFIEGSPEIHGTGGSGAYAMYGRGSITITGSPKIWSDSGSGIFAKYNPSLLSISGTPYMCSPNGDVELFNTTTITIPGTLAPYGVDENGVVDNTISVKLDTNILPTKDKDVQITTDWDPADCSKDVFVSTQGYAVKVLTKNGADEIYFTMPLVATQAEHCTLTLSKDYGTKGTSITITAQGETAEHVLTSLNIYETENPGKTVAYTDNGDGTYTFAMPAADVTVKAVFALPPHNHPLSGTGADVDFSTRLTQDVLVEGTAGYILNAGSYVLNASLDLSSLTKPVVVAGPVNLCLNGNTLKLDQIQVWQDGELSICDCSGNHSGTLEGGYAAISNSGTLHVYGGTIKASGYGIYNNPTGTANIYGGRISADGQYSAGIYNEGTLNASGANISGADCGIDNRSSAIATVTGGNIDGGIYGIRNQGSLDVKDCYIGQGRTAVTYTDGEAIFIPFLPGTPAAELAQWGVAYCTVDMNTATGTLFGTITDADPHVYMIADARSMDFNYLIREGDILETRLKTALDQEGWINVESFFIVDNMFDSVGPRNGYTGGWGRNGAVSHNTDAYQTVVYTLFKQGDSVGWGGSLVGNTLHKIRLDPVVQGTASTLSGSYEYDYVYFGPADKAPSAQMAAADKADYGIHNAGGTVTVSGSADIYGASHGIFTTSGTVNVTGGTVTGSTYGIYVESGTTNVHDGSVSGTVAIYNKATTNVHGGTITGTTTGIENDSGSLTVTNGTIQAGSHGILLKNGEATVSGGSIAHTTESAFVGIRVGTNGYDYPAKLTMTGGSILSTGRGIEIYSGEVVISGCNIHSTDNSAASLVNGTLTVTGGTFAGDKHAGIYVSNGTFNLKGAPVLSGGEAQIKLEGGNGAKITLIGELTGENPSYSIYMSGINGRVTEDTPVQITVGWSEHKGDLTSYPFYDHHEGRLLNPFPVDERTASDTGKKELFFVAYHNHTMSKDCHVDPEINEAGEKIDHKNVRFSEEIYSLADLMALDADNDVSNGIQLATGAYVLQGDITLDKNLSIIINGNVDLCLNGKKLNFSGSGQMMFGKNGTMLRICDCKASLETGGVFGQEQGVSVLNANGSYANGYDQRPINPKLECYGCTISGVGKAVAGENSTIKLVGCSITSEGRGTTSIDVLFSTLTVDNCDIDARSPEDLPANGIVVNNSTATITNSRFNIYSRTNGNGICVVSDASVATIDGCIIDVVNEDVSETQECSAIGIVVQGKADIQNCTITTKGTKKAIGIDVYNGTANVGGTMNVSASCTGNPLEVYGIMQRGTLELSGNLTATGTMADIYLEKGKTITLSGEAALQVPENETYTVMTAVTPEFGKPVQVTTGWPAHRNDPLPFSSANANYKIGELNENTTPAVSNNLNEVYVYIPVYNVTIDPSIVNGTVTADATTVTSGTKVTLTATPTDGYAVDSMTATYVDAQGTTKTIIPDKTGDGTYTFTMPAADVTITATFKALHSHYMAVDTPTGNVPSGAEWIDFSIGLTQSNYTQYLEAVMDENGFLAYYTLKIGSYVLLGDITPDAPIVIEPFARVDLCLNGKTLTFKGQNHFEVIENAVLNVCNCEGDGTIVSEEGAAIMNNGGFNLYGGTLRSNATDVATIINFGGHTTVYGGRVESPGFIAIQSNDREVPFTEDIHKGNVTIHGGYVIGKDAGIQCDVNCTGTVTVTGGTVTGYDLTDDTESDSNTYGIQNLGTGLVSVFGGVVSSGSISGQKNNTYGICSGSTGNVEISGSAQVSCGNVNGKSSNGYAVYIAEGALTVSGGTITTGTVTGGDPANNANTSLTEEEKLADDASVYGIYNRNGTAVITGGTVTGGDHGENATVADHSYGIYNGKRLEVRDNAVITAVDYGISNTANVYIYKGTISATGEYGRAVYNTGRAEVYGGTISAMAAEATGITNNGTLVVGLNQAEDKTDVSGYPITVKGNRSGIYNEGSGYAEVYRGTVTGTVTGIGNTDYATIKFNGGSATGGQNGIYNELGGNVFITGGTVTGTGNESNGVGNTGNAKVEISGGTVYGVRYGIYNDSILGNVNHSGKLDELDTANPAVLISGPALIGTYGDQTSENGINAVKGLVIIKDAEGADAQIKGTGSGIYVNPDGSVFVEGGTITGGGAGIGNQGLTKVTGGEITGNGGSGINNLGDGSTPNWCIRPNDGQLYVSGGKITGSHYGIANTAAGDIWLSGGTVIGTADSGLYLTGENGKCYMSNGWVQSEGLRGIYLGQSFLELSGGTVAGPNFSIYMDNVAAEGETDKIGTFRLEGAPHIVSTSETAESKDCSALFFDTHCRVTIIGLIPDQKANGEELSWSVLTAEQPTYDQPIPFTIDWEVTGDRTDIDASNMMVDEEGKAAVRKSFMTHFFTSKLYDVQLHTADAPTDDDLEVVLAISTEYTDTVVDVYLWAGANKGVYVSKEQLIAAVDRNPSPTLMFNREHTTLTADMVSGWYAGDRTGFSGEAYLYPSDSSDPEKLWIRTPNVGTQEFTATIGYSLLDNATGSMGYRETTFRIRVRAFDVKDSVFVLDYGLKADLNRDGALFAEDVIGMDQTTETHLLEALSQTEPQYAIDYTNWTQSIRFEGGQLPMTGSFGSFSFKEAENSTEETPVYLSSLAEGASLVYTPTRFMEGSDQIYLAMRVHNAKVQPTTEIGSFDPTKEVEMFKKVTVLPANVVYYEDFFTGLEWYNDEQTNDIMTIDDIGQNYAQYQDVDQDQEYGKDSGYETLDPNYTGSGGNYKKITVKGKGEILKFDFMGTGFDLVGSTTADSGSLIYAVYSIDPNEENPVTNNSNLVQRSTLNTVYNVPNGAIYEVPLLHVSDLAYGKYRVIITSVAKYDWSSDDRDPVTNLPPVKTAYLYLDGIRIYNPLSMMDEGREYYNMGEKSAQFLHLRSMLLKGQAAAAKITSDGKFTFGSGLVSYAEQSKEGMWYEGNNVSSLNDYLTAGPNNEVYFNENTQSLVLYAREIEPGEGEALNPKTMLQIAIRNLNPAAFDDHDPVPEGGKKDGNAPAFALLGSGGSTLQVLCDGSDEAKAISYSEQYYTVNFEKCVKETINGKTYYRIVISAGNGSAFALTNLKVNNLEFYTIPASASTYKYNNNGELIETNNPNATEMPNLQELAWQLQAANGMLPEDPMNPDGSTELVFRSISLSLQSSIGMNFYVEDETLEGYTDPYVVVMKERYDEVGNLLEEKRFTVTLDQFEKMTAAGEPCHVFRFSNIAAKEMNSTITATLYATKNGELVQGETRTYSVVQYAENMLTKTEDPSLKTLLVDMLNYGAAAQIYFNYNNSPATLANASQKIQDAQSYATHEAPIVNSYLNSSSSDEQDIRMEVAITNVSLSLEDRVEANFYMSNRGADLNEVALVVAYEDVTGNVVQQRIEGKDFIETQTTDATNPATYYKAVCDKLNATEMRTILNVWVVDKDGMRISNAVTYSIESYAASVKDKEAATDQLKSLLEAMMKYGDSTAAYFTKPDVVATMIQPWLYAANWDQARWNKEFDLMKELGMESLILQNVVDLNFNTNYFFSVYPTDLSFNLPEGAPLYEYDQLKLILEAAKSHDMTVYIGTVGDSRWFNYGTETVEGFAQWSEINQAQQVAVMEEIMAKYGSIYGSQIAGWYYHNEIWNVNGYFAGEALQGYTDALVENINTVIDAAESRPLMLSPYFNITMGTAAEYAAWWTVLFEEINFRRGDIFVPQDTVGKDGAVDTRIHTWIAALAKAIRKTDGMQFWVNNESFRESGSDFVSAPVEDFLKQYEASNLYAKKHILFSWNHYYSPGYKAEYQAYHDALKAYFS